MNVIRIILHIQGDMHSCDILKERERGRGLATARSKMSSFPSRSGAGQGGDDHGIMARTHSSTSFVW